MVRGETNFEGQDTATHTATHIAIHAPHTGKFLCACMRTGNKLAKEEKERIQQMGEQEGGKMERDLRQGCDGLAFGLFSSGTGPFC